MDYRLKYKTLIKNRITSFGNSARRRVLKLDIESTIHLEGKTDKWNVMKIKNDASGIKSLFKRIKR